MNGTYLRYPTPRSVREYQSLAGNEHSTLQLPWFVLDSLGKTIPAHLPDEYVVIGERRYDDGRCFLEFGATTAYVEATTAHRWDNVTRQLRVQCPACLVWDGKHRRGCAG